MPCKRAEGYLLAISPDQAAACNLFLHQLQDLFFDFGVVKLAPTNGAVTYVALFVDEVSCGKAADFIAVGYLAVFVKQDGKGWVDIQLPGIGKDMVAVLHLVYRDHGKFFTIELLVKPFH